MHLCSCWLGNTIIRCTYLHCTYRVLASVSLILLVGQHHCLPYRCRLYLQSTFRWISALAGWPTPLSAVDIYSVFTEYLQVYIYIWAVHIYSVCTEYLQVHFCSCWLANTIICCSEYLQMYSVLTEYLQVYLSSCQLANTIMGCTDVQFTYRALAGVSLLLLFGQHHYPLYGCTVYLQSTCKYISDFAGWPTPLSAVQM